MGSRFSLIVLLAMALPLRGATVDVWIGTTAPERQAQGIYHLTLDDESGHLSAARLAAPIDQPGFLALHPSGKLLYATGNVDGHPSVVAFRIDRSGTRPSLERINSQPTGDGGAAHLSVDQTGKVLFSAQYGGGSTTSYPIPSGGRIGPRASLVEHTEITSAGVVRGGSRVVPDRQAEPHPHWTGTSPDNQFLLVPDLGGDRIVLYRIDHEHATITPHDSVATPPGGGPRHFAFHPGGEWGYVVNELSLTLTSFAYQQGKLTPLQTIATLDEATKSAERFNSGSEVRVHPSGQFVYAANRGNDTITVFQVDSADGTLSLVEQEPIRGSWPRNFNLDRSGRWLLAAGRDSATLALFEIDPSSGKLQYTLSTAKVPAPICVVVGAALPAGR